MSLFNSTTNSTHKIITYGIVFLFVLLITFGSSFGVALAQVDIDAAKRLYDSRQGSCSGFLDVFIEGIGSCFDAALLAIAGFIFDIVGALTGWMSELLDFSIQFSLTTANYKIAGVQTGWEIFRDFANMFFIFILLYIAVMTILQLGGFNTKKVLANLIIVALLVNFSFFLTGVVIDASNVLGGFLYDSMTPMVVDKVASEGGPQVMEKQTLGAVFMTGLKIPLAKSDQVLVEAGIIPTEIGETHQAGMLLLASIVLLVAAFVFLAGALLFIIRTGVLMLVLMISPFAFVAAILPKTQQYWQKWVGHLAGTAFVAPIYLLLIVVVVGIINSDTLLVAAHGEGQNLLSPLNYGSDSFSEGMGIYLNYALIIFLLIAAMTISQQVSSSIGGMSRRWAGRITGFAASTAMSAPGAAFRGAERAMRKLSRVTKKQTGAMSRVTKAANVAARGLGKINKFSYDPRSTRLGKAAAAGLKTATGVDVGQAKKGREIIKEVREQEKQDKETTERREMARFNRELQAATTQAGAKDVMDKMTKEQVANIDVTLLTDNKVAHNLTPGMLSAMATNKDLKLTIKQLADIVKAALHANNNNRAKNATWLNSPGGSAFS